MILRATVVMWKLIPAVLPLPKEREFKPKPVAQGMQGIFLSLPQIQLVYPALAPSDSIAV